MKQLLMLIVVSITWSASGRATPKSVAHNHQKRIQIGMNYLSEYSFRTLKNNTDSNYFDYVIQERNRDEFGKFGFAAGLNVCFSVSNYLSIETGIQYASSGYRTKPQTAGGFYTIAPPWPYLVSTESKYCYRFLQFPVKVNFIYGREKIKFIGSLGLSTNYLMHEKHELTSLYEDQSIQTAISITSGKGFSKVTFSPIISAGFDCAFNKNMNIRIQPTYRRSISTIIDAPVNTLLFGVGMNVGYYYSIK